MIDDILASQADITPGDILCFYGYGNGSAADTGTPSVVATQFFMNRGNWPAKYVHTAVCVKNDDGVVQIIHLKEVKACKGQMSLDHDRDLYQHPFKKPILVIRPPEELRDSIIKYAHHALNQNIKVGAYKDAVICQSKPANPREIDHFKPKNTCMGVMINVLQFAYQEQKHKPFPLSAEISTVRFLHHMDNLKATDDFSDWQILLIPYIPTAIDRAKKQSIVDYILTYAESKAERLNASQAQACHKHPSQPLRDAISHFNSNDHEGEKILAQTIQLLDLLNPVMRHDTQLANAIDTMTGHVALRP